MLLKKSGITIISCRILTFYIVICCKALKLTIVGESAMKAVAPGFCHNIYDRPGVLPELSRSTESKGFNFFKGFSGDIKPTGPDTPFEC
jgi:hypothetical protein